MKDFHWSREKIRQVDQLAIQQLGMHSLVLMENAGRGVAELLLQEATNAEPIQIFCGAGNNGGDGFVIARHLQNAGREIEVYLCAKQVFTNPTLSADCQANMKIWLNAGNLVQRLEMGMGEFHPQIQNYLLDQLMFRSSWIVDALFGTGLTRAIESPLAELIAIINSSQRSILAVDLPSGLDCDTGLPLGPTIRATKTATFVGPKLGFQNPASTSWTGEVKIVDIGVPHAFLQQFTTDT